MIEGAPDEVGADTAEEDDGVVFALVLVSVLADEDEGRG